MKNNIKIEDFTNLLSDKYLEYALSTITSRALPDVRDGLKPVQRRIIYAMSKMRLYPENNYKKCAKIIGEVMGNYHPHSGEAIYGSLVRIAQDFSLRIPLAIGQGNFGSIDGDNPAAMRYTESKMSIAAMLMLDGLNEDAVDFRDSYDGEEKEPVVLPSSFPNLLINGSIGIAVGMATNIPTHNPIETIDAAIHCIRNKNHSVSSIMNYIKGPDLPTGGVITNDEETIKDIYKNGKGALNLRARWVKEGEKKYVIVITELPFSVVKSKLVEKIAMMIYQKTLPSVSNIIDESTEEIRIVIHPKSHNIDPEIIMADLFSKTDLETKINYNMNLLDHKGRPKLMNVKEILNEFNDHLFDVLLRRTKFSIRKINNRLEVLNGFLIIFLNIDEVIKIIRFHDEPKKDLMKKFDLSEVQADAILNLRLRALNKLEEIEIQKEHDELSKQLAENKKILVSKDYQAKKIIENLKQVKEKFQSFGDISNRKTTFEQSKIIDFDQDIFLDKEEITIYISKMGFIRTTKGHDLNCEFGKYKEDDKERFVVYCQNTDKIILFSNLGISYQLSCNDLPQGRGFGEVLSLLINISAEEEIVSAFIYKGERKLLLFNSTGYGFICPEEEFLSATKNGKKLMNLGNNQHALGLRIVEGEKIAIINKNKKILIFDVNEIPELKKGKGVILQKIKDTEVSDAIIFKEEDGLFWKDKSNRSHELNMWQEFYGKRALVGKNISKGFSKELIFAPQLGAQKID